MRRRHIHRRKNHTVRNMVIGCFIITLFLSIGYSAFQTIISISVRGNIKQVDFYVSNNGSDINGNGTKESPYLTIQKAYDMVSSVGKIYIMSDISLSNTINMNDNKKITLSSYSTNDYVYSVTKTSLINDYLISQTNGTLNIKKITLDGGSFEDIRGSIHVTNSKLILENQGTIQNFIATYNSSSGISAENSEIIVDGGIIKNNKTTESAGGAIRIKDGTLNINSGTISNNEARAGGAIQVHRSFASMLGGIIKDNTSRGSGGAIEIYGTATMTISGGEISNNTAGGHSGAINVDCTTTARTNCPTLTLNGGIIKNNTATNYGGGIAGDTGRVGNIVYNSGVICENTPTNEYETHSTCPS